jgi:S-adenosylmethionine:tRNA ribosyltransferase-isomerase
MRVSEFDFDLPPELVAQEATPRGSSRLMVLNRTDGTRTDASITDLPSFLKSGDVMALNDTKVFPARLLGRRLPGGGAVECMLIGRVDPADDALWDALVHPGQRLREGSRMIFGTPPQELHGEVVARRFHGRRTIRLWSEGGPGVDDLIDVLGHVPLPPYIKRPDRADDRVRYQTVFARERGSIAAPTAGLHFTPQLLDDLTARGVERVDITLHVGYGTFKPVRVDDVEAHEVDPEAYEISPDAATALNRALANRRRIVAVGTTTTRALESSAGASRGTWRDPSGSHPIRIEPGRRTTDLFIHPGHEFRVVGALLTNFHLPRSSLLLLVAAFAGKDLVLDAYRHAIEKRYRFYSYGDAMLIV